MITLQKTHNESKFSMNLYSTGSKRVDYIARKKRRRIPVQSSFSRRFKKGKSKSYKKKKSEEPIRFTKFK